MKRDLINELFSKKWVKEVNSSNNKNCLVMFSGGSDSALCLAILKRLDFNVEAIHFMNKWTWKLSTEEAKRISKLLGIKLHIYDITQEFISEIVGKVNGRPCALCKNIMDRKTIDFCLKNDFSWICEGDIAWDGSVNRIKNYESKRGNDNLYVTKYLDCVETGIELPENIKVLRPIIDMTPEVVEKVLLEYFDIKVRKNHEIGDKFHQYWREGCPLQYAEKEVPLTMNLMNDLSELNNEIVKYARERNIRASIYLPSKKIITVPQGLENEVKNHLIHKGYKI